jgi:hypothetical protein
LTITIFMVFSCMICRKRIHDTLTAALGRSAVVLLSGPRQSGKTTLAREFLKPDSENYFDLENPLDLIRLEEPYTALSSLNGLVVIDEVQRRPDVFPVLRVLVDRTGSSTHFLILGSASGDLLRQSSESLAGRIENVCITGFTLDETGEDELQNLWLRGGLPPSFTAESIEDSLQWRRSFIQTLLERDLPQWGVSVPATAMGRFWSILAHYHGQTWNSTEAARAMGVSHNTTQKYLDILSDALMVRQIQPFHANIAKRQRKAPKIYIRDSGLLHGLLGLATMRNLLTSPWVGASWEGFALEQVLALIPHDRAFFWGTHQGAEMDLLLQRGTKLYGVEIKRVDAPRVTKSMRISRDDLNLESVIVIYPGDKTFSMGEGMTAVPLKALATLEAIRKSNKQLCNSL